MARTVCPCGMPATYVNGHGDIVEAWTSTWHREHYARHTDIYPDIDDISRSNLLAKIAWATALEDAR